MACGTEACSTPLRSIHADTVLNRLRLWRRACAEAARQRRALAALDDRLLDDVGLTREESEREAARPPWDLPLRR